MPIADQEASNQGHNSNPSDLGPDVSEGSLVLATSSHPEPEVSTSDGVSKHVPVPEDVSRLLGSEEQVENAAEKSVPIKKEPLSPKRDSARDTTPDRLEIIRENWQGMIRVKQEETNGEGRFLCERQFF